MEDYFAPFGVNMDFQFALVFGGLVWTRLLAVVITVPFLFGKPVPMMARMGASIVLAAFAVPHLLPVERPPLTEDWMLLFFLFLKEGLFGLVIGFAASLIFHGFEAAGDMIDNQRGMSIARVLIPQLGSQGSLSSLFLFQLAIVVYLALGGHRFFLEALYDSFSTLPVFAFPDVQPGWLPLMDFLAHISGEVITLALAIAAPVIIAILLADIILGVANRMAPQINVWELGFNIKGYLGVIMLFLMMTLMLDVMRDHLADVETNTTKAVRLLDGGEAVAPPEVPEGALPSPLPWLPQPNAK